MTRPATLLERHFTVDELAEQWRLSEDFVRRLFVNEPGVMVVQRARPGRRTYRTIRIPESVAARTYEAMLRGFKPTNGTRRT